MFAVYDGVSEVYDGYPAWSATFPKPATRKQEREATEVLRKAPEVVADDVLADTVGQSSATLEGAEGEEGEEGVLVPNAGLGSQAEGSGKKRKKEDSGSLFDLDYMLYNVNRPKPAPVKKKDLAVIGEGKKEKPKKVSLRESVSLELAKKGKSMPPAASTSKGKAKEVGKVPVSRIKVVGKPL